MSEDTIQIKVKRAGDESTQELALDRSAVTTVTQLKELIAGSGLVNVPEAASQRLIYQGKILKDSDTLAKYNLTEGSCILMTSMPGARTAAPASPATTSPTQNAPPATTTTAPTGTSPGPAPSPQQPPSAPAQLPAHVVILRAAVQGIRTSNTAEVASTALRTLSTILGNITGNPHEAKYRTLKKTNAAFTNRVGAVQGCPAFLRAAGFQEGTDTWELAPSAQAWEVLTSAKAEVDMALAALPPPPQSAAPHGPFGASGMPSFPGMGGMDPNAMASAMQALQSNPMAMQQAMSQIRSTMPEFAPQAEALMRNPHAMQQAMQMMRDPGMMQQMRQMMGPGGMGGYGAAPQAAGPMPSGYGAPQAAPAQTGVQGQQGQQQAPDAQMTEEEMLAEAIARSLREM